MKNFIHLVLILSCCVSSARAQSPSGNSLGKQIANFSLIDFRGKQVSLSDFKQDV